MIDLKIYKFFADYVFSKTGIFYPEKDYYRLDSRINKLMSEYDCSNAEEVYEKFKNHKTPEMEKFLINICTNNETYFFRDDKPFKALANDMIPELQKSYPGQKIKIWSCASSTGQEPLSIIMSLLEKYDDKLQFDFDASDISTSALAKAKSGQYTNLEVQRGLPIQMLVKYFESVANSEWKAKPELTGKVNYFEFNLFDSNFPISKYHVIFCRNVLIYQDVVNKPKILEKLASALAPGGFLILGAGESLIGTGISLDQITLSQCMVFQRPNPSKDVA